MGRPGTQCVGGSAESDADAAMSRVSPILLAILKKELWLRQPVAACYAEAFPWPGRRPKRAGAVGPGRRSGPARVARCRAGKRGGRRLGSGQCRRHRGRRGRVRRGEGTRRGRVGVAARDPPESFRSGLAVAAGGVLCIGWRRLVGTLAAPAAHRGRHPRPALTPLHSGLIRHRKDPLRKASRESRHS